MSKLETRQISKTYRGRRVVDDVTVFVQQGEVVGLLGPNGAGKTTSFYMIVGLISPDSGRILVDDKDITDLPMYQRARRGISYLPQEASVFRKLTVEENLMAILETLPLRARERRETMERLLDQLGLENVRRSRGYMLSGGERRRVEIARSLVINPSFLLLDEPFSGIDPIQVLELQRIIFDLKRSGIGILVTDHNVSETLAVTDRAYIINEGRIFRAGSPEALARDPEVRRVYLGGILHTSRVILETQVAPVPVTYIMRPLCLLFLVCAAAAFSQPFSFGVKGGMPMTDFIDAARAPELHVQHHDQSLHRRARPRNCGCPSASAWRPTFSTGTSATARRRHQRHHQHHHHQ